jgi:hypothetical protein
MPAQRTPLRSTPLGFFGPPRAALPARAGLGLKPAHYRTILETRPDVGFFEVHAENYMGEGGPPHRYLTEIRSRYPLSLHGVGLSIGAARPLDRDHLWRLAELARRYQPALVSEHLAWSSHGTAFLNDLLPVPYTTETLSLVCAHIDEVQNTLRRQMLLENPATYVAFTESSWSETDFLAEVARRSGCALLLDVNNAYVASTNQGWNLVRYLEGFPLAEVRQIHLAGHATDQDASGWPLLIDSHDRPVGELVWALYERVIGKIGPLPTLIEWDQRLPAWAVLQGEAAQAEAILEAIRNESPAGGENIRAAAV